MAVAVIAILMAIIIPALGGAQTSARKAKTRAQFAQWATAIEQFRQEYGYYPAFQAAGTGTFSDGLIDDGPKTQRFVETLSGRTLTGGTLGASSPGVLTGNTKRIGFCSFGTDSITPADRLQDGFGNIEIVVLLDRNLDGIVAVGTGATGSPPEDYPAFPSSIDAADESSVGPPSGTPARIRAGVAFYSAGDGKTALTSW